MSRKQAERAARDSTATEREQIRARQAEVNAQLERNRVGEFDRRDLSRGRCRSAFGPRLMPRVSRLLRALPSDRSARRSARHVKRQSKRTGRPAKASCAPPWLRP